MEVLILSKTRFGENHVCVGGIVLENAQFVRLLEPGGWYQYANTLFNIGEVWELSFDPSDTLIAPHIEDVAITSPDDERLKLYDIANIPHKINDLGIKIWNGSINNIFDGMLSWTHKGRGYLGKHGQIPENSVGFWRPDKDLQKVIEERTDTGGNIKTEIYYRYPLKVISFEFDKLIKYVGCEDAIDKIPAGTLIRLSLAKWWSPNGEIEDRCYLQLSGWYSM